MHSTVLFLLCALTFFLEEVGRMAQWTEIRKSKNMAGSVIPSPDKLQLTVVAHSL